MDQMLHVSSNPHVRDKMTTSKIMQLVALALLPTTLFGIYNFGLRALLVVVITVASSVFFEWIYDKLMHKKNTITDFSAVVTGLLLALNMPASIPLWMPVLGSAFAIIVVKQLFGGLGQNFMNPALAGRCFLMISFAGKMTDFAVSDSFRGVVDTVSGATPLAALKQNGFTDSSVSVLHTFEKEKFDVVVNFAAESHVDRSIEDPGIFVQTNVMGTRVLLDASRKFGVKRYHQVSTDEVYGDLPLDRPDLFFTENTPIHTSSPYSASKASADLFVLAYHRTFGTPVTVSRCSNNYGPYHFPEKLIPLMISRALADEELPVYGNGENVRDWLHVSDHCEAIDLIIHKGKVGEVYNIGGHNERTNLQVVQTILKALDKPESLIKYVKDRPGHDRRYAIDPTKIETELGWKPKYNFDTGIAQTIQWYLDNEDWWKHIISGEYQNYFAEMYKDRL